MMSAASRIAACLKSVDFEVFGKVQGVFFRKYTRQKALDLRLVGWVKNTERSTVVGVVQGEERQVEAMKQWLAKEGSPKSRIDSCTFSNERKLVRTEFPTFTVIREKKRT